MRFTHLRDDFGVPFATVAEQDGVCGVSICSNHDQFSKKIGRLIASGRLEKGYDYIPDSPRTVLYGCVEKSASELVAGFVDTIAPVVDVDYDEIPF